MVEGASWQWIFWLNVPIGLAVLPLAWARLTESYGPATRLDLPGLVLASLGLFGIVLGVVRGNDHGWTSLTVLPPLVIGGLLVAAFIAWERRAPEPMLPLGLFRSRGFTLTNVASMLMFFGMFGSIFLLAQFLQVVQGYSPLEAGLRTLPWTGMPVLIAPIAGALSDRIGGRPLLVTGLALQAIGLGWLAAVSSPTVGYLTLVPAFVVSGIGMSLFFAPVANVVLGSVRRDQEGIASGANNAIRELGGVFGIAVLGAVFSAHGGYTSGPAFVSGLSAAVWVGAAAVALAAGAALLLPRLRTAPAPAPARPSPRPSWSRSADHPPAPGPGAPRRRGQAFVAACPAAWARSRQSSGTLGKGCGGRQGSTFGPRHHTAANTSKWLLSAVVAVCRFASYSAWQLTVPWISLIAGSFIGASAVMWMAHPAAFEWSESHVSVLPLTSRTMTRTPPSSDATPPGTRRPRGSRRR